VGIGAVLIIVGIVLVILSSHWILGLLLIILGLLLGGFRRGRWY